MKKRNVCVLFGGVSPEHEVSLRSAESVLNHLDQEKYNLYPVGITKEGNWILFGGKDYSELPTGSWRDHPGNRNAAISPIRGQGLLSFEGDHVVRERIDVVFPVLHGENGEDGSVQGLLQLAGIPFVGCHVAASAACMDKCLTKLIAGMTGVRQADWELVTREQLRKHPEEALDRVESRFSYPVFVKPAGTGSSVGVSKARGREALLAALENAVRFDSKVLVEEFIRGREVEVAVLGNNTPAASICGEIDAGAEFYDYETKYLTDTSTLYIPPASLRMRRRRCGRPPCGSIRRWAARVWPAWTSSWASTMSEWSSTRSTPCPASLRFPCIPSSLRPAAFPIPSCWTG